MVSVTSEALANLSFQGAPARSARSDSDPAPGSDSFAALVDSNAAAGNSDNRPQDSSAQAPRRTDDQAAASDRSRDANAAADRTARNNADDRDAAASARDNAKADADATADDNADATRRAKAKSAGSKSDETKSATKSSSADDASTNDQPEAKPDGATGTAVNAIAAAIPVVATVTDTPAAKTPGNDKGTAPLAIAAAAIAATAAIAGTGATVTAAATGTDASAPATATVNTKAAGANADAHAVLTEAAAAPGAAGDPTATTGIALAASVSTGTPATSKTTAQLKPPVTAKEGATTGDQDSMTGTATASTTVAPTAIVPAVTPAAATSGKPKAEGGIIDAVKADASGNAAQASAAGAAGKGHAADAGQTPVNSADGSLPSATAFQPQLPQASTVAAPAAQLNVTAATQGPVPLSGLAMEIAASAKSGKSRFEIRLDPADLGRIDVRIDVDRNGQVTSHLTVERPETLSMLRQDANQLQRALDNAGLSTGNGGLQFSLRDQSSSGQNDSGQSNPNAHRLVVSEEDTIPAVVAGRSYGRMLGSSSGVDIRV